MSAGLGLRIECVSFLLFICTYCVFVFEFERYHFFVILRRVVKEMVMRKAGQRLGLFFMFDSC